MLNNDVSINNINRQFIKCSNNLAIISFSARGYLFIVKLLIESVANVHVMCAEINKHSDMAELLKKLIINH